MNLQKMTRDEAWKIGGLVWCQWISAQIGEYTTEAEAKTVANKLNSERIRDMFWYSPSKNPNGGWDVCSASCDG